MPDEPDCPVCPYTPMEQVDSGQGFEVDECPHCGGRWYDAGELEQVVKSPDKLRASMEEGLIKPRPGERICPTCRGKLTNTGLINQFLRVDFCHVCRGFWLDKNEIGLVDKLIDA
ncbi:MAG: zf-TFIIB domain-containing protein [Elusimicrobiota bacterium]